MWTSIFAVVLALCAVFGAPRMAAAGEFGVLRNGEDTGLQRAMRDECAGTLLYNHDGSFEAAYYWGILAPPYYGAWGEGYDLGAVNVECGVYWFTRFGELIPPPIDLYVWEGGVQGPPGSVLSMVPGVVIPYAPPWPAIAENHLEIGCFVSGAFTVGFRSTSTVGTILCAADHNGSGGHPWTCIAPGLGYPSGWQHPNVVYSGCVSMGIGATVTTMPSPAESETWGAIKSTFRR